MTLEVQVLRSVQPYSKTIWEEGALWLNLKRWEGGGGNHLQEGGRAAGVPSPRKEVSTSMRALPVVLFLSVSGEEVEEWPSQ